MDRLTCCEAVVALGTKDTTPVNFISDENGMSVHAHEKLLPSFAHVSFMSVKDAKEEAYNVIPAGITLTQWSDYTEHEGNVIPT